MRTNYVKFWGFPSMMSLDPGGLKRLRELASLAQCILSWKSDLMKNPQLSGPLMTLDACIAEEPQTNSFGKLLWSCMAADSYLRDTPTTQAKIKENLDDLADFFKHSYDVTGLKPRDVDQDVLQKMQKYQKDSVRNFCLQALCWAWNEVNPKLPKLLA